MSKTTWNPTKQEEELFKTLILPLSAAMLKQHGTFESAIRSNPTLLQNMHAAINKIPAHSPQIQWVAQQDQSISLSQLEESRQKLKSAIKKIEEGKSVSDTPQDCSLIGDSEQLDGE